MKSVIPVFILFFLLAPGAVFSQETPDPVRQFRRTVFKLQQEMLELKEQLDKQNKELTAQKEHLTIEVDRLTSENKNLKKRLFELDGLLFQLEDRLEDSAIVKLSKEVENLRNLVQATILESLDHPERSEKLLLEIINQPGTSLPKDLLILILAQQKSRETNYDDAISYYSTLLAEFFGSPYFSQAIYEMSEILGQTGRTDNQITLLTQLSSLSATEKYSLKAAEKLNKLGLEILHPDDFTQSTDGTSDAQPVDITADASMDQMEQPVSTDSTGDLEIKLTVDPATPDGVTKPFQSDISGDSVKSSEQDVQVEVSGKIESQPDSTSDLAKDHEAPGSTDNEEQPVQSEDNAVFMDESSDAIILKKVDVEKTSPENLVLPAATGGTVVDDSNDLKQRAQKGGEDVTSDTIKIND